MTLCHLSLYMIILIFYLVMRMFRIYSLQYILLTTVIMFYIIYLGHVYLITRTSPPFLNITWVPLTQQLTNWTCHLSLIPHSCFSLWKRPLHPPSCLSDSDFSISQDFFLYLMSFIKKTCDQFSQIQPLNSISTSPSKLKSLSFFVSYLNFPTPFYPSFIPFSMYHPESPSIHRKQSFHAISLWFPFLAA